MRAVIKDNRGMSLIEIIIVVAIMGALIIGTSFTFGVVFNREEKAVIDRLDSELKKVKVETMSRSTVIMKLYRSDLDNCYYVQYNINSAEYSVIKISKKNTTLYYATSEPSAPLIEIGKTPIEISYKRGSGALEPTIVSGASKKYIGKIATGHTSDAISIVFYPQTGKHKIQ